MVDPLNRKAYYCKEERKPKELRTLYWFCEFPQNAAYFKTRSDAEWGKEVLNRGVNIKSVEGGTHTIDNFEIEEYEGRYILSCSGPFLYEPGKEQTGEATDRPQ
jgi:hypothetical protein